MSALGEKIAHRSCAMADIAIEHPFRCETYGMAAATLLPVASQSELETRGWATVFSVRATKDELVVMELFGLQNPATPEVRVLAHIRNVRATVEREPQKTLHAFSTLEHAQRFADEATVCFEYLGCIVGDALPIQDDAHDDHS